MNRNSKGFGVIEIILIVAAIALVGFVGWKAWDAFSNNKTADTTVNVDQAPVVNNTADLDKSAAVLDATNIDGTESTQLNSEINL
ncbi:hypothetical protein COV88_00205 [Candidatus Saccharibacteria bacterium CG11_big_fil_rev_8_21_14_0_20_41_19]|nr:tetratricopeptide repeat protein [Candidatus Saccharibacteria bacterium]OIP85426.1 MAG: hypothetical protein AUK57_03875 [Candidatus Saccharibacteria bacterium CG2_30_41_52]PIQ71205.1 MAG: hypothetical protein COV88_00205 [Candidatus Saccharibacteria bacterium CG11_big_fil_rev_8_21_14_0_20_41_19]PIZ59848.1 MAG: hypothetical protein COY18_02670 [Candidatus Saccharibacteria bacterium CG_4_10_14_0_2_um_filter_41_11]PJC29948.1 MAG: hypothetical protein CO052_00580 [Candidatus Saccharibacteria ba